MPLLRFLLLITAFGIVLWLIATALRHPSLLSNIRKGQFGDLERRVMTVGFFGVALAWIAEAID